MAGETWHILRALGFWDPSSPGPNLWKINANQTVCLLDKLRTAPAADGLAPAWWPQAEREAASAWLLKSVQKMPGGWAESNIRGLFFFQREPSQPYPWNPFFHLFS